MHGKAAKNKTNTAKVDNLRGRWQKGSVKPDTLMGKSRGTALRVRREQIVWADGTY
jgi:hypothetical protein